MTDRIGVSKSGPATSFYLECDRVGQDINGNYTTLKFRLRNVSGPGATSGSNYAGQGWQRGSVDGSGQFGEHYGNPFLPSGYGNGAVRWNDGDWYMNIGHNADGGRGGVTLRMHLQYGSINEQHTAWFDDFPTIPRTSSPSWINPAYDNLTLGSNAYLVMNRASASFTHTADYYFGNASGRAFTGVGHDANWTPPLSLANQIPTSDTGVGTLRTHTYNGGTLIGWVDQLYRVYVPSSVVPTWSGNPTLSEGTAGVAASVGAYVQGISTLSYSISGAAGALGSTINTQRMSVAGQNVEGASGTSAPIAASGTVPVTFLVQDSRNRTKTETRNITVLPYASPSVSNFLVQRALSDGTVDVDDGTYFRVQMAAAVQSLMNTTQRNIMQLKIYTRLRGTTAWTLKKTITPAAGKISWNSMGGGADPVDVIPGPFDIDKSYDIRMEVIDRYNTSAAISTITVAAIFMHWAPAGLGVNKYHELGALDVGGQIYQNGLKVHDKTTKFMKPTNTSPDWTFDPLTGRINLTPGTRSWSFDGIFTPEFKRYRINYSYYTGDENGAWIKLRRLGSDTAGGNNYNQHSIYGSNTTALTQTTSMGIPQIGFPSMGAQGHSGYIEVSEPMTTEGSQNQKRFEWRDTHFGIAGNTIGSGWLGNNDTVAYDGFTISLSNLTMNAVGSGSAAWISVTALA